MTMQKKLLILLLTVVAGGVAQANDANIEQATSMSEVVRMLHEQEKASRPAQKPVSEMSDEEVLAHAAEKASDTVVNIGIGALSAIERFQKKAIGAAANAIRKHDSRQAAKAQQCPMSKDEEPDTEAIDSSAAQNVNISHRAESTETDTRTATDEAGERLVVLIILALVVAAILYGIAYMRVNSGNMVVYSSWGDFAASAAWVVLFLVGAGCKYAAESADDALMISGTVMLWCGGLSAAWMVLGAIQNKSIVDIVFAVPARIIVAVLVLFAWSKLKESLDELKNGRKGIVDGVLIPLGIALFVFNSLVKPMIGDRRG